MIVLALCGSVREPSSTRLAMNTALDAAAAAGAEVRWPSQALSTLPFCDGRRGEYGEAVATFRAEVASANAILIGSPEYHGAFSGVLKNALDLLEEDALRNKLVAVVATAKGDAGAMNTLNHLRHVVRWMNAWVLPAQVSIPRASERAASGEFDAELTKELAVLGQELVRYGRLLANPAA